MAASEKYLLINIFIFIIFIFDRVAKHLFLIIPQLQGNFILGVLEFRLSKNFGIAFGFPSSDYNKTFQFTLVAVIFIIVFFMFHYLLISYKQYKVVNIFAFTLILYGAISNLLDRIFYGFVIDFIDVPFFTVFNISDVMITFGAGMLIIKEFFFKKFSH